MDWLVPSVIATLMAAFALSLVYLYLYFQNRESYLGIWSAGWLVYTLRFVFELLRIFYSSISVWLIVNQGAALFSGLFLLWGAYSFAGKKIPRWWIYCSLIGYLWIVVAVYSEYSFQAISLPTFIFLGIVYIWTGLIFFRYDEIAGIGKRLTGLAFILWGIHKLDYPFLRPLEWFAPWGYMIASLLSLVVALGMLLIYFEKTKRDLQLSEERYRSLFQNANDAIYLIDPLTGKILDCNIKASEMDGYSTEELKRMHAADLHPAEERDKVADTFMEVTEKGEVSGIRDIHHVRKDGALVPIEVNATMIEIRGEHLNLSIVRDRTERLTAENALRESERQYRLLFETNPHPMWVYDLETLYFLAVNDAAVEHYGYSRQAFLAMTIKDIRPTDDVPRLLENIARVSSGIDRAGVWRHIRKDGSVIYVEIVSHTLNFAGRQAELVLANDITDRLKLEEQLRQSQKMEAVGQLAGGVAHDFNNILSAIIGYANLMQMKVEDGDPLRLYLDQILASSERAATLVQSLLAFSRKQVISLQPVDLNDIVEKIGTLLSRVIGEDIKLKTILAEGELTVLADGGQVEQVLMNLATNARDAMPEGGLLIVETEAVDIDEEFIRVHEYGRPGRYALVSVTDSGEGMDEETKGKIFEPFFTTKEMGRGTGLGLSMVYGIIKQHEGYIDVYSEQGKGTKFKIYLPLVTCEVKQEGQKESRHVQGGGETVLVAEDDEALRKLTRDVLERYGYTIIEAGDGQEAVEQYRKHEQKVDLLVLDVIMPRMNGREVYEEIRRTNPQVKVLFLSGYSEDIIHRKGILEEGLNFALKPVPIAELLRKVRSVLDS